MFRLSKLNAACKNVTQYDVKYESLYHDVLKTHCIL